MAERKKINISIKLGILLLIIAVGMYIYGSCTGDTWTLGGSSSETNALAQIGAPNSSDLFRG